MKDKSRPDTKVLASSSGDAKRTARAALEIGDREARAILFQHSVFAQTSLPYRDPGDDCHAWQHVNGAVHLRVETGTVFEPITGHWQRVGLPYGTKPRLILAYLNREALIQNTPEIDVDDSLTAFVRRMLGYAPNGKEIRRFKDQLTRLAAANVRLGMVRGSYALQINSRSITEINLQLHPVEGHRVFWPSKITLSPEYFTSLKHHAVPLDERAIGALAHSAMALDLYAWLAQRLRRVENGRVEVVAWPVLHRQFGWEYRRTRRFREAFVRSLRMILEQYPTAKVRVTERGLTLAHSPPPIPERMPSVAVR